MTKQRQRLYAALDAVGSACIAKDKERLDKALAQLDRVQTQERIEALEEKAAIQAAMEAEGYKTPFEEARDQGLLGGL